jgi:hypothetical protein
MQGGDGATRGNATSSRRVDERQHRDKRQLKAESAQQKVAQQPAEENERQMGGQEAEAVHQEAAARQEMRSKR